MLESDVIIVGPSRTSKSPTCIYLAYRGIKAANVPFVKELEFSSKISEIKNKLIVGFNIDPEILIQIRKARIKHMGAGMGFDYIDVDKVKDELAAARRLYAENNWPTIDISRKSVEETATSIIQMFHNK